MIEELLTIKNVEVYFVVGIILLFGILESISGFLKNSNQKKRRLDSRNLKFFSSWESSKTNNCSSDVRSW